ncbi:MAG: hypothetical protein FJX54_06805 [Alphaproteobacteria bacterium]|nr:hypothetical protein [Alphaproteobacteria bacterium]
MNEIKSFKASTEKATQAVATFVTASDEIADRNRLRRAILEQGSVSIELSAECNAAAPSAANPCRVLLNGTPAEVKPGVGTAKVLELMTLLADYAASLEAVASSKDIAEATSAIGALSKDVGGLIKAFMPSTADQKSVDAIVGPFTGAITWIAGNHLNYKRYVALKQATDAVQPALQAGKGRLAELAMIAKADYVQRRRDEFVLSVRPITRNPGVDAIPGVLAARKSAAEVAALINASPAPIFDAMVKAHGELAEALKDPSRQFGTLTASVQAFKKAVDDLTAVLP